ncbi:GNAT family N-acetyltransferase [Robertkochia flava]|uniref:GNAT family N-acetyltransferase n=1 Tax=Robertkochia flava TaxID=3447986 RepID=UPI001CC91925|nr:GNAT family N-acetyltransferase [Robertkochia marina]
MKMIGETPRLYLREFLLDDSVHFYEMNNDEEVLKYTGDQPFGSRAEALDFLKNYKEYLRHGLGRWAVIRKSDQAFLGWCGLKFHPDKGITEIGFRLYRKYWGNGYATEAAEIAVEFGFRAHRLMTIHAHVHVQNTASEKVLKKLGMHLEAVIDYEGMPAKFYKLDNPDYRISKITATEVLEVRHPVLREGRPRKDAIFDGDTDPETFHVGVYYRQILAGVVTLMKRPDPEGDEPNAYQLRGMGVNGGFRRLGVGMALVKAAETEVLKSGSCRIWMNAREKAVSFYLKLGYEIHGELFEIPGVGPHYRMKKTLNF